MLLLSRTLPHILAATTIVTACGASVPTAASEQPGESLTPRRIVVLGDSLAVYPSQAQSFPSELQRRIGPERPEWTVTNAGINGDTTAGGARRVEALLQPDVGILIVALGANDGLRGVAVTAMEQNLSAIIEAAQARGITVLLCGMQALPLRGWEYTIAFQQVFPRLAEKYGVPLVPFLLDGVAFVPEMNGRDGIHPNAAGARRIADSIWPYLERLLSTSPSAASSTAAIHGLLESQPV